MVDEKHWLDYLAGIGSIATPILVIILSAIGWKLRQSFERQRELEEKLREDRIQTYNSILEPFIILLMTDQAWSMDKQNRGKDRSAIAVTKMLSLDYRKSAFKLSLVGSDAVVFAYNDLMQYFFARSDDSTATEESIKQMMGLLGTFLLQIRRSMGNESTALSNWQMLEWFITDARKWQKA